MHDLLYYLPASAVAPEERCEQALLLESLAASQQLRVRSLSDQDLGRTPAELLADRTPADRADERWEEGALPFLYIAMDERERLEAFFSELRRFQEQGLLRFPLKAARTRNNMNWSLRYLFGELQQEHAWFSCRERLMKLGARASSLPETERTEALADALRKAAGLFQDPQNPPAQEAMEEAAARLEAFLPAAPAEP